MKKIKIMLLSLALLAVVGGALAFKARFNVNFCTTTFAPHCELKICPNLVTSTWDNATTFYCTTTPIIVDGRVTCIKPDGQALGCLTTPTVLTSNQ